MMLKVVCVYHLHFEVLKVTPAAVQAELCGLPAAADAPTLC